MTTYYLLRQPTKLEDMAIEQIAVWIEIQAIHMMSTIPELHKVDATKAETVLSQLIERIQERIECNVPRMLYDVMASKTIAKLYRLSLEASIETNDSGAETNTNEIAIRTIGRMGETLFTKNMSSLTLSFEEFSMLRKSLCSKSCLLTGLASLDLNFEKTQYKRCYTAETRDDIVKMIQELHSLKYLKTILFKADRIIECVVENCPLIEELVIDTYPVGNHTIQMLSQLRNLKIVTFKMAIHSREIEPLLLNCKNIEQIHATFYGYIHIYKAIKRMLKQNAEKLKLKFYRCQEYMSTELRTVVRMCPQLENLIVYPIYRARRSADNLILDITNLKDLCKLTLLGHNFYRGKVNDTLKVIGCNLEYFHLVGATDMDMNAMIEISQLCPYLQHIFLKHCKFVRNQTSNERVLEYPPFKMLKKITLDMSNDTPHDLPAVSVKELEILHEPIFYLLANCTNVEYIEFVMPRWLTEDAMLRILDKNPFKYLREFKIWSLKLEPMTTLVIERIIENCIYQPEVIQVRGDTQEHCPAVLGIHNIEL